MPGGDKDGVGGIIMVECNDLEVWWVTDTFGYGLGSICSRGSSNIDSIMGDRQAAPVTGPRGC